MKILVIHQVPYQKIDYRQGIDHDRHDVTYIGHPHRIADLPPDLRCRRIALDRDEDLVAGITARTSRVDGYDKLLSLSEFGILEAWHVRRHLGLDGPSLTELELVRDKVRMKEALAGSGLRFPRFAAYPPADGLPWTGPTVVKPRRGASSEDVSVHATTDEALVACEKLENLGDFQLEEYVEGDILHADGLVSDGTVVNLAVSRYVNKPLDYVDGAPLGSHQVPYDARHHTFAVRAIEALRIDAGCVHVEFFETPQGDLVFLEAANRMGGAGVGTAHLRHTGVHLPSHEIAIRLGLPRPEPAAPTGRYHAWLVFPGHHLPNDAGHAIHVPEHLRVDPSLDRLYTLGPEDPLPDHITYHEWMAPVFIEASHHNAEALRGFLEECVRSISVQAGTTS